MHTRFDKGGTRDTTKSNIIGKYFTHGFDAQLVLQTALILDILSN